MFARIGRIVVTACALILFASTVTLAADAKASGTIVAVTEEVVKFKGADGKSYELKAADVIAENLKTGDIVEYEIVEGAPVKVKKKK